MFKLNQPIIKNKVLTWSRDLTQKAEFDIFLDIACKKRIVISNRVATTLFRGGRIRRSHHVSTRFPKAMPRTTIVRPWKA